MDSFRPTDDDDQYGRLTGFDATGIIYQDKKLFIDRASDVKRHPELGWNFVRIGEKLIYLDDQRGPYVMEGLNANTLKILTDGGYFASDDNVHYYDKFVKEAKPSGFEQTRWYAFDGVNYYYIGRKIENPKSASEMLEERPPSLYYYIGEHQIRIAWTGEMISNEKIQSMYWKFDGKVGYYTNLLPEVKSEGFEVFGATAFGLYNDQVFWEGKRVVNLSSSDVRSMGDIEYSKSNFVSNSDGTLSFVKAKE
ncbi:MAG: DKNYY domain-containing protein [Bdellovibrionales bacterium]|nr:DKNYY domain-containing protein [Bdellovibrionales bacterium]